MDYQAGRRVFIPWPQLRSTRPDPGPCLDRPRWTSWGLRVGLRLAARGDAGAWWRRGLLIRRKRCDMGVEIIGVVLSVRLVLLTLHESST